MNVSANSGFKHKQKNAAIKWKSISSIQLYNQSYTLNVIHRYTIVRILHLQSSHKYVNVRSPTIEKRRKLEEFITSHGEYKRIRIHKNST